MNLNQLEPFIFVPPKNLAINWTQNSNHPGKLRFITKIIGTIVNYLNKYIIISINSKVSIKARNLSLAFFQIGQGKPTLTGGFRLVQLIQNIMVQFFGGFEIAT